MEQTTFMELESDLKVLFGDGENFQIHQDQYRKSHGTIGYGAIRYLARIIQGVNLKRGDLDKDPIYQELQRKVDRLRTNFPQFKFYLDRWEPRDKGLIDGFYIRVVYPILDDMLEPGAITSRPAPVNEESDGEEDA